MISGIILFLIETKIGRTVAITGAIVIGVGVGWLSFKTHYYNQGWNAAIAAIALKNKEATDAVNKATSQVDACNFIHGRWNVSSGMCEQ